MIKCFLTVVAVQRVLGIPSGSNSVNLRHFDNQQLCCNLPNEEASPALLLLMTPNVIKGHTSAYGFTTFM